MILRFSLSLIVVICALQLHAQDIKSDSTKKLNEIEVKGYYHTLPLLRSVAAISLIDSNLLKNQPSTSLLSTMNTVAGLRMEERSPGSYRLSLRGSLLRSPFGIRNIKIYMGDFPLTDAGGNTYLNLLDMSAISSLEIYKGPEASTFGANTGGAVLISSTFNQNNKVKAGLNGGSFGLWHQNASYQNNGFSLIQAYQKSDGYRENSALKRKYIQAAQRWNYSPKGELKALLFYSDLAYQTPGGLTALQVAQNPKMARPASPTLPSAITQKAAIYNQTIFAGLSNIYQFNPKLKHVLALFGSNTDFKNPFISNYEKRKENTLGLRTFFELATTTSHIKWNAQLGMESSSTQSKISNFKNNAGVAGALKAKDDLNANQNFGFLQLNVDMNDRLLLELASSLNFYNYHYQSYFPMETGQEAKRFKTQWMPKVAASYLLSPSLSIRTSLSKGYSAPTLAEVRSSNNIINPNLQAEHGWNYEIGTRFKGLNNRLYMNVNAFTYQLKNAIVRRLDPNDVEYFINAGGTKQQGIEIETAVWLIQNQSDKFLSSLQFRNSYTFSNFRFTDFINANSDFSGRKLTGVPDHNLTSSLSLQFKKEFYSYIQYQFTSAIPLNDANTAKSKSYNLVELKIGKRNLRFGQTKFEVFAGINNLLNEKYSLGNDLNAANDRYFNPAATINFYGGLSINLF